MLYYLTNYIGPSDLFHRHNFWATGRPTDACCMISIITNSDLTNLLPEQHVCADCGWMWPQTPPCGKMWTSPWTASASKRNIFTGCASSVWITPEGWMSATGLDLTAVIFRYEGMKSHFEAWRQIYWFILLNDVIDCNEILLFWGLVSLLQTG